MNLPVIFAPEIISEIEYIKYRNQFNTDGLSQLEDYLEWISKFISNKSIAWDYAGQFKSDRYGNVYFNSSGYNLVFNLEEDEDTAQVYVVIVDIDLNINEFGLVESKQRKKTLIITEQQYNELFQMQLGNVKDMRTNESKVRRNVIRLTESMLKAIIAESVNGILKEITLEKDSYQAKPKNGGRLNDWELMHILTTIVSSMISDKRVSKEDGEMLLHYALYNNDCYSHVGS